MEPRGSIHIQAAAPPKLALSMPRNGCGICCLVEPDPLGVLISRRRSGACDAVRWDRSTGAGCDSSLDSEGYGAPAVAANVVHQLELEDAFIDIDIDNPA